MEASMNYTVRKIIFAIMAVGTFACGFIAVNIYDKKDSGVDIFGTIFIIGIFASYIMSFFTHDSNDGSDY